MASGNIKDPVASNQLNAQEVETEFEKYLYVIVKEWLQVMMLIGGTLIPLFWILDYFSQPSFVHVQFAVYRIAATVAIILQLLIIKFSNPGKFGILHGYIFSFIVGMMIIQMTVDLGGLNSSYYAGLMLVLMAVNMLLSWRPVHSIINGVMILSLYLLLNLYYNKPFDMKILLNNLYFLSSTIVITVAISWVRFNLVHSEFMVRAQLLSANDSLDRSRAEVLKARDALWGEMQIAKQIQTAMLPDYSQLSHFETAAFMASAIEVGGDYYDVLQNEFGESWVAIGDVSGHGVDSGLIMMMVQTSIRSILNQRTGMLPSEVLHQANKVIKENVAKLGMDRYMTIVLIRLGANRITFAGKHTDFLMYHSNIKAVETIETKGSWLGIVDDLGKYLQDRTIPIAKDDIILLYTDGVIETENEAREQFGEARLKELLRTYANRPIKEIGSTILDELRQFQKVQDDDISLVLLRSTG
jgi:serine phosphatase RsbU (regulator of sigma subunit)